MEGHDQDGGTQASPPWGIGFRRLPSWPYPADGLPTPIRVTALTDANRQHAPSFFPCAPSEGVGEAISVCPVVPAHVDEVGGRVGSGWRTDEYRRPSAGEGSGPPCARRCWSGGTLRTGCADSRFKSIAYGCGLSPAAPRTSGHRSAMQGGQGGDRFATPDRQPLPHKISGIFRSNILSSGLNLASIAFYGLNHYYRTEVM